LHGSLGRRTSHDAPSTISKSEVCFSIDEMFLRSVCRDFFPWIYWNGFLKVMDLVISHESLCLMAGSGYTGHLVRSQRPGSACLHMKGCGVPAFFQVRFYVYER
jgi:hypothetical protein